MKNRLEQPLVKLLTRLGVQEPITTAAKIYRSVERRPKDQPKTEAIADALVQFKNSPSPSGRSGNQR